MLLRRWIYLVALALGSGTVGYGIALRATDAAPAAQPAVVEPAAAATPAPDATVDWTKVTERDLLVAPIFVTARNVGVEAALDSLVLLAERDAEVFRKGHDLAHAVGRVAIAAGGNDPAVLARCRPLFQAGCYHGVLEGYLASVPEVDAERLTGFCAALDEPGAPIIAARECAHGLGHGLIERLGYEFAPALRACDAFAGGALREECHDGIFMQNLVMGRGLPGAAAADEPELGAHQHGGTGDHPAMAGAGFRADDLAFPCNTVEERYQASCWSYQPVAIRRFLRDAGPRALAACELAPPSARTRCYAGYGKQTLSRYDNDQGVLIELCSMAPRPHDDACIGGLVELLIDREWGPENALEFCGRVARYGRDPGPCYASLGERIALLHATPRETAAVCALAVDPRHVEACVRAAAEGA
jgi:hypothetical protein